MNTCSVKKKQNKKTASYKCKIFHKVEMIHSLIYSFITLICTENVPCSRGRNKALLDKMRWFLKETCICPCI